MAGPDISAVGAAARGGRGEGGGSKEQVSFSVRKGDNGGVMVSENYESKPPAGRRRGAAFPGGFDSKENPFGPTDQEAAHAHITGLLADMTGAAAPAARPPSVAGGPPPAGPLPPVAARMPMRPPMPPFGAA